jgi:hypothetical protein
MVDDKLIGQLKKYIKEHYQLAGEPVSQNLQGGLTNKHGLRNLVQHSHRPPVPSFENIANTLSRFIGKERKSETFSRCWNDCGKRKG